MTFLISETFTDSLTRLTGEEQKAVKTTAFDLQLATDHRSLATAPGMSFHKLDKARDKNFWSIRVSGDIRIIVHKTAGSLLLCYVDHHDKAYDWAERRKLENHPKTGAAQLVEVRETVQEVFRPIFVETSRPAAPAAPLFANVAESDLLGYGVPAEWLQDVRKATEDSLFALAAHLPAEASEALLELATGGKPRPPTPTAPAANPFDHPDAQRRFRIMTNVEELQRALDFPWEKWAIYLHPEQRQWVEKDYNGPARVSGSAGTGKTIVALHRAAHLARTHPDARVLLTTFSDTLAHALQSKLKRLLGNQPRLGERIDVHSLPSIGLRLYKTHVGPATLVDRATLRDIIATAANVPPPKGRAGPPDPPSPAVPVHTFTPHFLLTEWEHVVDAWQLTDWDAYRDVVRLGRKTRLPEPQRKVLWAIFDRVRAELKARHLITDATLFNDLAAAITKSGKNVFDFAVIDESQDISISHLRFLAALGAHRPDALFFAGDLGQRIFQQPFSWKALGIDVRGRSRTLRVNYRTSHQIRSQADRLLGPSVTDIDGTTEDRSDAVSVFNGPPPTIQSFKTEAEESGAVAAWITAHAKAGVLPHEFGIFVRSEAQLPRARAAVTAAGLPFKILDDHVKTTTGHVSICTMHLAKGLEFRAVAVMACDDEIIPLQERIETVGDDADLREVYDTERHLLYVACTRARDHLLVTSVAPASEFLDDMANGMLKTARDPELRKSQ
jgi:superfamily I DNA/RNA helicase/mRNA-degrading endonuclease RelE of RelBE toxin-antitoxin system